MMFKLEFPTAARNTFLDKCDAEIIKFINLEACIFDANLHHDPPLTILLQLARHRLVFIKNHNGRVSADF
jgi:hypothetical protein